MKSESEHSPQKLKRSTRKSKRTKTRSSSGVKMNPPPILKSGKHFFPCSLCDISFSSKQEKFLHDETIHFEGAPDEKASHTRLYSSICGKSSLVPREISKHNEDFHSTHFKFICHSCTPKRKFTSKELLKCHEVIHSSSKEGADPIGCLICPEEKSLTFKTPVDLDNHLSRVHFHAINNSAAFKQNKVGENCDNPPVSEDKRLTRGIKVDPCRFCGFREGRKGLFGVRLHEKKFHPEVFVHICTALNCSSSYATLNELLTCGETHRESESGVFKCFVCNAK